MIQNKFVFVIILCCYSINVTKSQSSPAPYDFPGRIPREFNRTSASRNGTIISEVSNNLEYRLMNMEVHFIEKFDRLNSELRENNNRLQVLEWQCKETQRSIDGAFSRIEAYLRQGPRLQELPEGPAHVQQQQRQQQQEQQQQQHQQEIKHRGQPPEYLRRLDDHLGKINRDMGRIVVRTNLVFRHLREISRNVTNIADVTKHIQDNTNTDHEIHSSVYKRQNIEQLCNHTEPQSAPYQAVPRYPTNCLDILATLSDVTTITSGIYQIRPKVNSEPIMAYCDMETNGGGWTVIQRRYDGAQDFYRPWQEYRNGFGNVGGEFWLGLENMHDLTGSDVYELLIELIDQDGVRAVSHYGVFSIGNELERYRLRALAGYKPTSGSKSTSQDVANNNIYDQRSGGRDKRSHRNEFEQDYGVSDKNTKRSDGNKTLETLDNDQTDDDYDASIDDINEDTENIFTRDKRSNQTPDDHIDDNYNTQNRRADNKMSKSRKTFGNHNKDIQDPVYENVVDAGDSLSYHGGSRFSTYDVDEDGWLEGNCAQSHGGGWWYNQCDRSNLNGRYLQPRDQRNSAELPEQLAYQGMYWHTFHGPRYSLRESRMMIRPSAQFGVTIFPNGPKLDRRNDDEDVLEERIVNVFDRG